ncbi:hypothetical protein F2Q36_13965 [Alistipes onderdonkii]|uniref:Uncharacterized protein n=2 Tax=Alistipes onderdonkii TaxID=328813 RepID=A0A9P4DMR8_9BACT|nr:MULTISPECIES: hypothetical protein [Alistipes]KAA2407419.1 hypothetical protein F2X99_13080 [Alistipes onderdonkii]KAA2409232.1 hypothetical protein F2Y06_13610 [Alistipes onderdonkii]KAA2416118.1 hypothetical protein F2Y02_13895 [Alistipes onderdonkii]KAA2419292.1 hypothetical protein F2X88_13865 [Alistipes onderdonkii]KAA2421189.1 hypothetical protein F2X90_13745 [Alistipes onderdonkii]
MEQRSVDNNSSYCLNRRILMLLTAMHDNPNQGFWQANAKNNPPAIIKESTVSPDKRMILFCMCFENQSGSVAQILTVAGTKLMQISSR